MQSNLAAHSHPWKISDVVIFPLLLLGAFAEWLWPTIPGLSLWIGVPIGLAIATGGFALIILSKRHLDKANQPSLPEIPTTELVTTGPFAWSRNPNYLGAVIAVLGGAIVAGSLWMLATAALTALILDRWMIGPEERYLTRQFPDTYPAYCRQTRRWL